ncbi:MAG TPA: helical backbone metal receptor [Kineosporiaceae bacterium]|jgi:ABC-type Fe3+-hydroxamate transport system substrate-binding protein|nr:helical backbone metal receptor [Kineosporiaceae bacterium]
MRRLTDDTGREVDLPDDVSRVVSIVPSLTEAVAVTAPGLLVGATDWCTHPAGLDVARVKGTKNPDVQAIVALRPDVVVAAAEENRAPDLDALHAAGIAVWVTDVRTLGDAFGSLERMLAACGLPPPAWLAAAEQAWSDAVELSPRRRAVVPVWRRPWMAAGPDTFTASVLARLGVDAVPGGVPTGPQDRYPRFDPATLTGLDLVVLPDEPYLFTADDGPEAFPGVPAALVSGRHLTWYGPSLEEAPALLLDQLSSAL